MATFFEETSDMGDGPSKVKNLSDTRKPQIIKILKGQVSRTNRLGWATLEVQVSLGHFKHFFPVLQNLAHM